MEKGHTRKEDTHMEETTRKEDYVLMREETYTEKGEETFGVATHTDTHTKSTKTYTNLPMYRPQLASHLYSHQSSHLVSKLSSHLSSHLSPYQCSHLTTHFPSHLFNYIINCPHVFLFPTTTIYLLSASTFDILGPVRVRCIIDMGTSQNPCQHHARSVTIIYKNVHVVYMYACSDLYEHDEMHDQQVAASHAYNTQVLPAQNQYLTSLLLVTGYDSFIMDQNTDDE